MMIRLFTIIYIPLWLYYNKRGVSVAFISALSTFHSGYITMEIGTDTTSHELKIYIPLWLYYNFEDWLQPIFCYSIYIPLWLYYNPFSLLFTSFLALSTFHSGYITILWIVALYVKIVNLGAILKKWTPKVTIHYN